jgi:PST family polysaccharide transporter
MRGRAVSNARWIAVSRVVSVGVQLLSVMWLARLLTPVDYGVVAMALIVTNFANLVRDMGTGQALIQKEDLNQETILTAFWFTLGLGAVLGILVVALAPLMAFAFEAPAVTGVLWVLAATFPLLGSTAVNKALLERASRFPLLARVEAVSAVTGLAAGVSAAYLGAGPYSLALNTLAYALVSSTQLWLASPLRPRWFWSQHEFRSIRRFSDYLVGFNIINYFSRNADSMIIGRFLGAESLGMYSLAYRIMLFPLGNLTFVVSRALYPVMSRQQAVPEEMAALYLRTLAVIAFVTAPMMAGLFVLRDLFVAVLLGSKWASMADILFWLAPVGFIQSLTCTTGSVLMARGRTDVLFYLGIACTILVVAAFMIGVQWGVVGVAAAYCIENMVEFIPVFYIVLRELNHGLSRFLRIIVTPMALALVMGLVVHGCKELLPVGTLPAVAQLVLLVLVGVTTYAVLGFAFARQSFQDVFRFFKRPNRARRGA